MRVGGEVEAPVVLHRVEPNFESCQKKKIRLSGVPIIEAIIDERGTIREARILKSSHECIDEATLAAIRQWRFRPGTYRGKPVPVVFNLSVRINWR